MEIESIESACQLLKRVCSFSSTLREKLTIPTIENLLQIKDKSSIRNSDDVASETVEKQEQWWSFDEDSRGRCETYASHEQGRI